MKLLSRNLYISVILCILIQNQVFSLNLKSIPIPVPRHIVIDNSSDPTLHHIIRRNPTITTEMRETPYIRHVDESPVIEFGNSSDNNGPFLQGSQNYGSQAEIANPAIYVHSKGKLSVITEQPAHVGWRDEKKVITSLNKETSNFIITLTLYLLKTR